MTETSSAKLLPNLPLEEDYSTYVGEGIQRVNSKQVTRFSRVNVTIDWRIKEFDLLMELFDVANGAGYLESLKRAAGGAEWAMHVLPRIYYKYDGGWNCQFHLQLADIKDCANSASGISAVYQISVIDAVGNRVSITARSKHHFTSGAKTESRMSHQLVKQWLQADGALVLSAEIEYFLPVEAQQPSSDVGKDTPKRNDVAPFSKLLEDNHQSDFSIVGTDLNDEGQVEGSTVVHADAENELSDSLTGRGPPSTRSRVKDSQGHGYQLRDFEVAVGRADFNRNYRIAKNYYEARRQRRLVGKKKIADGD